MDDSTSVFDSVQDDNEERTMVTWNGAQNMKVF